MDIETMLFLCTSIKKNHQISWNCPFKEAQHLCPPKLIQEKISAAIDHRFPPAFIVYFSSAPWLLTLHQLFLCGTLQMNAADIFLLKQLSMAET
jgi:hypothetical protein